MSNYSSLFTLRKSKHKTSNKYLIFFELNTKWGRLLYQITIIKYLLQKPIQVMRVARTLLCNMTLKNLRFWKRPSKSCEVFVRDPKKKQSMCHEYLKQSLKKNSNVVLKQRVLIHSQLEEKKYDTIHHDLNTHKIRRLQRRLDTHY